MMVQLVKVEALLHSTQETNNKQTKKLEDLTDRLEELERNAKTVKTAIRWIVASIGLMLTQFGESLFNWLVKGHGK